MSTIVDVCKLAGVSKATVSRVLNGTGQVKESTRETVFAAMEQLGYRPNSLAQALATNKSNSLGLILPEFVGSYFGTLLKQAASCAEAAKKQLIVTDGHNDPAREYEAVQMLADRRCDAIVLYSRQMPEEKLNQLKQQLSVPLVVINRSLPQSDFHTITFDQAGAARLMMNHLVSYGHRQIAYISSHMNSPTGPARLEGYQTVLKEHGIRFNPALVETAVADLAGGYEACQTLLQREVKFTALFAFNDDMAVGALKALTDAGIRVPEQISLAGIDNEPMAAFCQPALTTIELPIGEMTRSAIELALKLADDKKVTPPPQFKGKLIQRDSVMPLNATKAWLSC